MHYPKEALDKFEEVSYLCKNKDKHNMADFLNLEETKCHKAHTEGLKNYIDQCQKHFTKEKPEGEEEGGEPAEPAPVGNVPDLLAERKIFQWAGVGFSEEETYRIQKSLKAFVTKSGATQVRFWGKVYGTERDYYVAEGKIEGGEEEGGEEKPADFEARGTGVNENVFWVANSCLSDWVQLPDIKPSDIQASRDIKVNFSGNLEREIVTNPFFKEKEKVYLRCQIARISHATTLCPKNVFKLNEENPREVEENVPEEDQPKPMPSTEELSKAQNWVHLKPGILGCNRTVHMESDPPEGSEIEPEDWKKQIEAKDPFDARLSSIAQDAAVHGQKSAWIVRLCGDKTRYQAANPKDGTQNFGVVVVRSLRWPGSFTCF